MAIRFETKTADIPSVGRISKNRGARSAPGATREAGFFRRRWGQFQMPKNQPLTQCLSVLLALFSSPCNVWAPLGGFRA
jgi:hypothetical protein